jgi:hypothetical protein
VLGNAVGDAPRAHIAVPLILAFAAGFVGAWSAVAVLTSAQIGRRWITFPIAVAVLGVNAALLAASIALALTVRW